MNTAPTPPSYKRHRFPGEIIRHCVGVYFRFGLSDRAVEERMTERGVTVSYAAVRYGCRQFGQAYANQLRRHRAWPGDKWHLAEAFLTIHGARHSLWRAVDQDGNVLDTLGQRRREKQAAKKFFRKLLTGLTYVPRVLITEKLQSYSAAKREVLPGVAHRQPRDLHKRAEHSHHPTRQRERRLPGVEVRRPGPAVPGGVWAHGAPLPPAPPPLPRPRLPAREDPTIPDLAGHYGHSHGRLRAARGATLSALCLVITSR